MSPKTLCPPPPADPCTHHPHGAEGAARVMPPAPPPQESPPPGRRAQEVQHQACLVRRGSWRQVHTGQEGGQQGVCSWTRGHRDSSVPSPAQRGPQGQALTLGSSTRRLSGQQGLCAPPAPRTAHGGFSQPCRLHMSWPCPLTHKGSNPTLAGWPEAPGVQGHSPVGVHEGSRGQGHPPGQAAQTGPPDGETETHGGWEPRRRGGSPASPPTEAPG